MNNETNTNKEYILFFRGTDWTSGLSPEQIQTVMSAWKSWFERLTADGRVTSGRPLEHNGKVVSGKNGRVVADGPFAESKEAIGGYFMLAVDSMEEAVAIAKSCPGLEHGCVVEVRQFAEMCPAEAALEKDQLATAAA
jgi:hypothetical protein